MFRYINIVDTETNRMQVLCSSGEIASELVIQVSLTLIQG